jgi:hypothetical protein
MLLHSSIKEDPLCPLLDPHFHINFHLDILLSYLLAINIR